jgi:EamA domain-containing membrane protein RarD
VNESAFGVALVAAAAIAWSTAGCFTRLIPVALFAMLVWRNVFGGVFMTACVFATQRRQAVSSFLELGVVGWLPRSSTA